MLVKQKCKRNVKAVPLFKLYSCQKPKLVRTVNATRLYLSGRRFIQSMGRHDVNVTINNIEGAITGRTGRDCTEGAT